MDENSVERVEDKRMVNGRTEYYLKWKGYPRSENTWEPVDQLDCPNLIANFEESLKNSKEEVTVCDADSSTTDFIPVPRERQELTGFERGLEPSKILGATDASGQLMFLMKWKGCDRADMVPAKLAKIHCPQTVIKFYVERLSWHNGSENGNDNGDLASSSGGLGSAEVSCSADNIAYGIVSTSTSDDEEETESTSTESTGSLNQEEDAEPEMSSELDNGQSDDDD